MGDNNKNLAEEYNFRFILTYMHSMALRHSDTFTFNSIEAYSQDPYDHEHSASAPELKGILDTKEFSLLGYNIVQSVESQTTFRRNASLRP
jgi:hypothetical protein